MPQIRHAVFFRQPIVKWAQDMDTSQTELGCCSSKDTSVSSYPAMPEILSLGYLDTLIQKDLLLILQEANEADNDDDDDDGFGTEWMSNFAAPCLRHYFLSTYYASNLSIFITYPIGFVLLNPTELHILATPWKMTGVNTFSPVYFCGSNDGGVVVGGEEVQRYTWRQGRRRLLWLGRDDETGWRCAMVSLRMLGGVVDSRRKRKRDTTVRCCKIAHHGFVRERISANIPLRMSNFR